MWLEWRVSKQLAKRDLKAKIKWKLFLDLKIKKAHEPIEGNTLATANTTDKGTMSFTTTYVLLDIMQRIKLLRLPELDYVIRMDISTPVLKVLNAITAGGSKGRGGPNLRWKSKVEKDLSSLGVYNFRQSAQKRIDRCAMGNLATII